VHVLVFEDEHKELQVEGSDHADQPPVKTQSGFFVGTVQAGTQSSNISESPAHGLPSLSVGGLLQ
jgi:hypothetical protein